MNKSTPLAHIVSNNKEDHCNRRHWDHSCKWHQNNKHDDQCDGVDDSGNRGTSSVFDICCGTCDRSGSRDSTEKSRGNISRTLSNEFHIGAVLSIDHAVSNYTGEQ